jgi:hypothetical protein
VDCDLVGERFQAGVLHRTDEQNDVRQRSSGQRAGGLAKSVARGVEGEGEALRPGAREEERVAAVARTDIDGDVAESSDACGDLTDVYVEKLPASELAHR